MLKKIGKTEKKVVNVGKYGKWKKVVEVGKTW